MRRLRSEISRLNTSLRERSFEVDDLKSRIGIMESSQKVIIHEAAKSKEQVVKVEGGLAVRSTCVHYLLKLVMIDDF